MLRQDPDLMFMNTNQSIVIATVLEHGAAFVTVSDIVQKVFRVIFNGAVN